MKNDNSRLKPDPIIFCPGPGKFLGSGHSGSLLVGVNLKKRINFKKSGYIFSEGEF